MSDNIGPRKIAFDTAEKVLAAIYGEDLEGCVVTLQSIAEIVEQGIESQTLSYKLLSEALIGAVRQIQTVSTPPEKDEVKTIQELADLLGDRADAIHQVTTKILDAWEKAKEQL
jgi:hypothetical protein